MKTSLNHNEISKLESIVNIMTDRADETLTLLELIAPKILGLRKCSNIPQLFDKEIDDTANLVELAMRCMEDVSIQEEKFIELIEG